MIMVPDQGGCGAGLVLLPLGEDGNGGSCLPGAGAKAFELLL